MVINFAKNKITGNIYRKHLRGHYEFEKNTVSIINIFSSYNKQLYTAGKFFSITIEHKVKKLNFT